MNFQTLLSSDWFRFILIGILFFVLWRIFFGLIRWIVIIAVIAWLAWHFWLA